MKEPFVPKSTISEMLPLSMRREFFRRIIGKCYIRPKPTGKRYANVDDIVALCGPVVQMEYRRRQALNE